MTGMHGCISPASHDLQAGYLMCEPGRTGFAGGVVPLNLAVRVIPSMVRCHTNGGPRHGTSCQSSAPSRTRGGECSKLQYFRVNRRCQLCNLSLTREI